MERRYCENYGGLTEGSIAVQYYKEGHPTCQTCGFLDTCREEKEQNDIEETN